MTINFEHCDFFFKSTENYSHLLKMKIYSIFFNYNLVTSKKLKACLLEITLDHSSVAYLKVSLAHFQRYIYIR